MNGDELEPSEVHCHGVMLGCKWASAHCSMASQWTGESLEEMDLKVYSVFDAEQIGAELERVCWGDLIKAVWIIYEMLRVGEDD